MKSNWTAAPLGLAGAETIWGAGGGVVSMVSLTEPVSSSPQVGGPPAHGVGAAAGKLVPANAQDHEEVPEAVSQVSLGAAKPLPFQ